MSLEDDIGSFSKRRELEVKPKEKDVYEYEDDDSYADINFRMYKLDELDKFNVEVEALDELISPWWKNLPTILTKATFGKIGILEYKRKHLFSDDKFENVHIADVHKIFDALEVFGTRLKKDYWRRFRLNVYQVILYVGVAFWYEWNMIWYILLAWSVLGMVTGYFNFKKKKEWVTKAVNFLFTIDDNSSELISQKESDNRLEEVMAFNSYISQEEKEHWSVKLYDAISNLFKGKK